MPKLILCVLAVFLLSPLLVCLALLALLYFVFARFCDLTELFFETLPWVKKRPKSKLRRGLGLHSLRDVFSKLQHGKPAVSLHNQAGG